MLITYTNFDSELGSLQVYMYHIIIHNMEVPYYKGYIQYCPYSANFNTDGVFIVF